MPPHSRIHLWHLFPSRSRSHQRLTACLRHAADQDKRQLRSRRTLPSFHIVASQGLSSKFPQVLKRRPWYDGSESIPQRAGPVEFQRPWGCQIRSRESGLVSSTIVRRFVSASNVFGASEGRLAQAAFFSAEIL